MKSATRVVLVNEFSDENCPVTKLVYDLGYDLRRNENTVVVQANLRTKYRPGGTRWQRILSLVAMHILMPLVTVVQKILARIQRERLVFVVTTLPPLIHWELALICMFLRIPIIIWYQDAHPEIEARYLKQCRLGCIADVLTSLDRLILCLASRIVVLDNAMADLLRENRGIDPSKILVAPPWTTFVNPAKPIRGRFHPPDIKLLYAGNYGLAHDLSPLAHELATLPTDIRSRVRITGIGMNEDSRRAFEALFIAAGVSVNTLPRADSFSALLGMFDEYQFGIVSLRADFAGIAAPSKAFTYLSQGLPILYVGPERALPSDLVDMGMGLNLTNFIQGLRSSEFSFLDMDGRTLQDPKQESAAVLMRAIYAT